MHASHPSRQAGFTLVELSVVLVIIALLVGGILVGRIMIRSQEIRALTVEHDEISTAVRLFKERYGSLPGDMPDATRYWGELDADPVLCSAKEAVGTKTCNGDGNAIINGGSSNERFRLWQHLANADLLQGRFTGVNASGGAQYHVPGVNTPKSKLGPGGWSVNYSEAAVASASIWGNIKGYYTRMCMPIVNSDVGAPVLNPEEMWTLDNKMDDGLPATGILRSAEWDKCSTATGRTDYDAEYNVSRGQSYCCPMFMDVVP